MGKAKLAFGLDLKKRRLNAGLSQVALAAKVSVSQPTISMWETGKTTPEDGDKKKLDGVLGTAKPMSSDRNSGGEGGAVFGTWLRSARAAADMTVPELSEKSHVSIPQIYNLESGRSANPREQTRKRLEQALDATVPDEITEEAADEQAIVDLGPLTDFDPHDEDDRPRCAGVYVFYDVSDRPIYVGKSQDIKKRVASHQDKFWFKSPIVDRAAFVEVPDERLRHQIEQVLIKFLKSNAVINKQSVDAD